MKEAGVAQAALNEPTRINNVAKLKVFLVKITEIPVVNTWITQVLVIIRKDWARKTGYTLQFL
jgi:hypothetical protein